MKIKIKISKPSPNSHSTAQIVASIDDLLIEILLRLPIRSLISSKLVSKHWHSLITNPRFCLLRSANPNPAVGCFLTNSNCRINTPFEYIPFSVKNPTRPPFMKFKFSKGPSGITILQSCNGLMLCSSLQGQNRPRTYYVYNPTTTKYTTLPKLEWENSMPVEGMSLAFDPTKSVHYKVICVRALRPVSDSEEFQYQIDVYSSEAGPWRTCEEPYITTSSANFKNGVYWNGAIHWINTNFNANAVYFNLDHGQAVQVMPMPPIPGIWDWRSNHYFGESGGHLHFAEFMGSPVQFNVYEMKRDYSEWYVKYQVDLSPVVESYPEMIRSRFNPDDWYYYAASVFCVIRGGEKEDSFIVLQIPGKVIKYSLVDGSFEIVHEFKGSKYKDTLAFPCRNQFQYIESLCCV